MLQACVNKALRELWAWWTRRSVREAVTHLDRRLLRDVGLPADLADDWPRVRRRTHDQ